MWRLYDELIEAVPQTSTVSDIMVGRNWVVVRSDGIGLAMAPPESGGSRQYSGSPRGQKTRDVAQWVKSWNFTEAAIGLAAINSAVNHPQAVERRFGSVPAQSPSEDLFDFIRPQVAGRKVTVVGHFPDLERLSATCCLSILERRPRDGDYPDPACEYILRQQDVVIMTATTLINKTMPRLLELSQHAQIAVCGPSTPMVSALFEHGVTLMGGCVVEDETRLWQAVQEGLARDILSQGCRMLNLSAHDLSRQVP